MKSTLSNELATILQYLTEVTHKTTNEVILAPDTDIFEEGIIDSIGLLSLISFLEESFSVDVNPEDVTPMNFTSPRDISKFISVKRDTP